MAGGFNSTKSINITSEEFTDGKYLVKTIARRNELITSKLVTIGYVIYYEPDNVRLLLKEYPTFGSLTGVVWEEIGQGTTPVVNPYLGDVIYVDANEGVDNNDIGRGSISLPYATQNNAEESITDNIVDIIGDTTVGSNIISNISATDIDKIHFGQRIVSPHGTSFIDKEATVVSIYSDSIIISTNALSTTTGSVLKLLNKSLIIVNPGIYNNSSALGKESVNWLYRSGAITINKHGNVFTVDESSNSFYDGINVYGEGEFESSYYVYYNDLDLSNNYTTKYVFECFRSNGIGSYNTIKVGYSLTSIKDYTANLKGIFLSDLESALELGAINVNVNSDLIKSNSTYAIYGNKNGTWNINALKVDGVAESAHYAVYFEPNILPATFNVDYCSGYNINNGTSINDVTINGHSDNIILTTSNQDGYYNLNGYIYSLHVNVNNNVKLNNTVNNLFLDSGNITGGKCYSLQQTGGVLKDTDCDLTNKTTNISGGESYNVNYYIFGGELTFSGGNHHVNMLRFIQVDTEINNGYVEFNFARTTNNMISSHNKEIKILGTSKVDLKGILNTFYDDGINFESTVLYPIKIDGGNLNVYGKLKSNFRLINYISGSLVINNSIMQVGDYDCVHPIVVANPGLEVNILTGGLSTNDLLVNESKLWYEEIRILSPDLETSFGINDGVEDFIFDVNTNNNIMTKYEIIQDLITQIANSTANLTTTENGSDVFTIHSPTLGTTCIIGNDPAITKNVGLGRIQAASYDFALGVSGPILENTSITI